jgi:uncharacterized protein YjbI with pentapeptide repeats
LKETIYTRADCSGSVFHNAVLHYADFSHATLVSASFMDADLMGANLHRVIKDKAIWMGANMELVKQTDPVLAMAEDWRPPAAPKT